MASSPRGKIRGGSASISSTCPLFGIEILPQSIAYEIERENGQRDRRSGNKKDMRINRKIVARLFDHRAPARGGRRYSQSKERKRGFGQDRAGHAERCLDDQRL